MAEAIHRPTWLEIDLQALLDNVNTVQRFHSKRTIWPVLKANAYHHGVGPIAQTLIDAGISHFSVSNLDEAIELQNIFDAHKIDATILIFGDVLYENIALVRPNWCLTMSQIDWIKGAKNYDFSNELHVHLEVDSGMHRRGLQTLEETQKALAELLSDERFVVDGIYTHFAVADTNMAGTEQQAAYFRDILHHLDYDFKHIHCANSNGALLDVSAECNGLRPGAIIYGIGIHPDDYQRYGIRQIASLYSSLVEVKQIKKGEHVGYGWTYEAEQDEWIGIIPIGYADGWVLGNQGRSVYIDGHYCEIIGRVCMDQMMVRLPGLMPAGVTVELFGSHIPLYQVAAELGTIDYEVICLLDERIMRTYIK